MGVVLVVLLLLVVQEYVLLNKLLNSKINNLVWVKNSFPILVAITSVFTDVPLALRVWKDGQTYTSSAIVVFW